MTLPMPVTVLVVDDHPMILKGVTSLLETESDLEVVDGVARRGLLVRHLVMPNGVAGSRQVLRFLAEEVSPDTCVNVMEQYRPLYHARRHPEIARPITDEEYAEARLCAERLGLRVL